MKQLLSPLQDDDESRLRPGLSESTEETHSRFSGPVAFTDRLQSSEAQSLTSLQKSKS